MKSYEDLRYTALTFHATWPYPTYQKTPSEIEDIEGIFRAWVMIGSRNILLTGDPSVKTSWSAVRQFILEQGLEYYINVFVNQAVLDMNIKHPGSWQTNCVCRWSTYYIEFIKRTPEFPVLPEHLDRIEDIKAIGFQINNFILDLRGNKELFEKLMTNYNLLLAH